MRYLTVSSLLVLLLAACGLRPQPTPEPGTSPPAAQPAPGESPVTLPETSTPAQPERGKSPLPEPEVSPISPPSDPVADVVEAAVAYLAVELDVSPEEVNALAVEPVEWSDASLGCPEPGRAYAQVVTPGYRLLLKAGGKEYEVHTDRTGQSVVTCERELEKGPSAALEYLADELDISPEEVGVLSIEMYEWPDASLGCPEPGKSYAQVVTPGYRVLLKAAGKEYELHTDQTGRNVVVCEPDH